MLAAENGDHRASEPATVPGWTGFRPLRATRIVPETAAITSIYLEDGDGRPLPQASPGQYLTVRVGGAGQPPPVRGYSSSSAPGADAYRISVKNPRVPPADRPRQARQPRRRLTLGKAGSVARCHGAARGNCARQLESLLAH
jgi:hypothetical protein